MICDDFADLLDLYAIGALDKADSDAIRAHLDTGCETCGPRFIKALMLAAEISETVPVVEPPPSLRNRIAASVAAAPSVTSIAARKTRPSIAPWLFAAAAVIALVGAVLYEENLRRSDQQSYTASIESANRTQAQHTAAMLSIVQAPGTKQVAFKIDESNLPHGSLFIHKELGVAMLVAKLPTAPAGFKYESWVVPKEGAPKPIESFDTDKNGFGFTVVKGPVDVSQWKAMAVSIEPANSNPVTPTKVLFASGV